MIKRRQFIFALAAAAMTGAAQASEPPLVTVYLNPS
jgi:hypothetical protein